jgi:hypothetical protein
MRMKNMKSQAWVDAVARHSAAASAFAKTAGAMKPDVWSTPLAEGKWSPAQVTEHLNRTYQMTLGELRGKGGLQLTHHVFGEIDLLPGIDFIAIHIEHHQRQITGRS